MSQKSIELVLEKSFMEYMRSLREIKLELIRKSFLIDKVVIEKKDEK